MPNGSEFLIVKGRIAESGTFDEGIVGFLGIAVFLDDTPRKARHRGITASFGNNRRRCPVRHIRIKVILEEGGKVDISLIQFNLGVGCPEEETSGIEGVGVKIRKDGVDEPFHIAVCDSIGHRVNGKENVELGSCCLAVFLTHIRTAVVNGKGHTGECFKNICGHYPIVRVLGVVIVTVYG